MHKLPPVITIDGPSGVGKGTIAKKLACTLKWHYLDSGALYRTLAWYMLLHSVDINNEAAIASCLNHLTIDMTMDGESQELLIYCAGEEVSKQIRQPQCGDFASKISAKPTVRKALLDLQRAFRRLPGLVTDGRDMGTVVFPDAELKLYFNADIGQRARRRFNQLKQQEINVSLPQIRDQIAKRDQRDRNRQLAPLKSTADMVLVDTTELSVDEVFAAVLLELKNRRIGGPGSSTGS